MEPNFVDELDCDNLFDQIDDLIDFPPDNECNLVSSSDGQDFQTWNNALPDCYPFFFSSHVSSASDLSAEISVPMEWLSTFVEDSFSGGGLTLTKDNFCTNNESSANQFQTSSPVSVSESTNSSSTSSSSGGKTMPPLSPNHRGPQRARSKRPRPLTLNPWPVIQLISPSSSSVETPTTLLPPLVDFLRNPIISPSRHLRRKSKKKPTGEEYKKKNKKIKITLTSNPLATPHDNNVGQAVRKCLHCEITKTPQWRAGPMGPKTLCNACGVRYKSGRLFPEYRPAASPTFIPSLHSNSHKKVVEMRSKVGPGNAATAQNTAEDLKVVPNA